MRSLVVEQNDAVVEISRPFYSPNLLGAGWCNKKYPEFLTDVKNYPSSGKTITGVI